MNRILLLGALIIGSIFLYGMGDIGGSPSEIPIPKQRFIAIIVDDLNIETYVDNLSFDGNTFIKGKLGKASITIPFKEIKTIEFIKQSEDKEKGKNSSRDIILKIIFKDNKYKEININGNSKWYGKTDFGNLTIKSIDIKKIDFE